MSADKIEEEPEAGMLVSEREAMTDMAEAAARGVTKGLVLAVKAASLRGLTDAELDAEEAALQQAIKERRKALGVGGAS